MSTKKYVSPSKLSVFLENCKNFFATKTTVEDLSSAVAYINTTDNEDVTVAEDAIITDDELNELLTLLEDEL